MILSLRSIYPRRRPNMGCAAAFRSAQRATIPAARDVAVSLEWRRRRSHRISHIVFKEGPTMERRSRERINAWLIAMMGLLLIWSIPVSGAAEPIDAGYRDMSYPAGTGGNSRPTGEKPESKLWVNDGVWWGILWSTPGNAYRIHRLDLTTQEWVDTGTVVDNRAKSRADVLWDGQHLYVVSHIFTTLGQPAPAGQRGVLFRFSYDAGTQTYSRDAGFPVEVTLGKSETLVLAKDSTSTLWVTYVESQQVMVNHSLNGDDQTWSTPVVLPVPGADLVGKDDISSIIAFDGRIGVMWSDQHLSSQGNNGN